MGTNRQACDDGSLDRHRREAMSRWSPSCSIALKVPVRCALKHDENFPTLTIGWNDSVAYESTIKTVVLPHPTSLACGM